MNDVKRHGMLTLLLSEKVAYYRELHKSVWPEVLRVIKECRIQNYSIFLKEVEGNFFLFSYYEYVGENYDNDMKKLASDISTKKWWKLTSPTQKPLQDAIEANKMWSDMEELFHLD